MKEATPGKEWPDSAAYVLAPCGSESKAHCIAVVVIALYGLLQVWQTYSWF